MKHRTSVPTMADAATIPTFLEVTRGLYACYLGGSSFCLSIIDYPLKRVDRTTAQSLLRRTESAGRAPTWRPRAAGSCPENWSNLAR